MLASLESVAATDDDVTDDDVTDDEVSDDEVTAATRDTWADVDALAAADVEHISAASDEDAAFADSNTDGASAG